VRRSESRGELLSLMIREEGIMFLMISSLGRHSSARFISSSRGFHGGCPTPSAFDCCICSLTSRHSPEIRIQLADNISERSTLEIILDFNSMVRILGSIRFDRSMQFINRRLIHFFFRRFIRSTLTMIYRRFMDETFSWKFRKRQ